MFILFSYMYIKQTISKIRGERGGGDSVNKDTIPRFITGKKLDIWDKTCICTPACLQVLTTIKRKTIFLFCKVLDHPFRAIRFKWFTFWKFWRYFFSPYDGKGMRRGGGFRAQETCPLRSRFFLWTSSLNVILITDYGNTI